MCTSCEEFIERAVNENGFLLLPIRPNQTALLISMPYHHRNPFGRPMIAQATAEEMQVVSADAIFDAYPIIRLWKWKFREGGLEMMLHFKPDRLNQPLASMNVGRVARR